MIDFFDLKAELLVEGVRADAESLAGLGSENACSAT